MDQKNIRAALLLESYERLQRDYAALQERLSETERERDRLRQSYEDIENATLWRISAPLRRLLDRNSLPSAVPALPPLETPPEHTTPEPARHPLISVIIPSRDHAAELSLCVESVLRRSSYRNFEILIIENGSREPETERLYAALAEDARVRLLRWEKPFNYAALQNFAAREARGEVLLLLNNDTAVLTPGWLEELLSPVLRPDVGIVGAKLLYEDGRIQHAGLTLRAGGEDYHLYRFAPRDAAGEDGELLRVREVDAVTGACLMIRKSVWEELGGMDESFPLTFNDADLCLRARERGYRVVCTPFAELLHRECATRGSDTDPDRRAAFREAEKRFRERWGAQEEN